MATIPSRLLQAADRVVQSVRQRLSLVKASWGVGESEPSDSERHAKELVAQLADPVSRRERQSELWFIGRPAIDPLLKALDDESLRPFAEVVLIELGALAEPQLHAMAMRGYQGAQQTLKRMGKW